MRRQLSDPQRVLEPLAILLLEAELEQVPFEEHARALLRIPRVIVVEPSRRQAPRFLRDSISFRQAKRLRFPGQPRMLVLYHPAQYPLARALTSSHAEAELWYLRPDRATIAPRGAYSREELIELDELAAGRATRVHWVQGPGDLSTPDAELRARMQELQIINPRPFVPGARVQDR